MSLFVRWLDRRVAEQIERYIHKAKSGVLWVSDITGCRYKAELGLDYPNLLAADSLRGPLIQGALIHEGFRGIAGYGDPAVFEVPVQVRLGDGTVLRGRIDALFWDPKEGLLEVVELKTGRDVKDEEGSTHHVMQAWIYSLMLTEKSLEVDPDREMLEGDRKRVLEWLEKRRSTRTVLVYVTAGRIRVVPVTSERAERAFREAFGSYVEFADLSSIVDAWRESRVPLWSWECRYCAFQAVCPYAVKNGKDGRGQQRLA